MMDSEFLLQRREVVVIHLQFIPFVTSNSTGSVRSESHSSPEIPFTLQTPEELGGQIANIVKKMGLLN